MRKRFWASTIAGSIAIAFAAMGAFAGAGGAGLDATADGAGAGAVDRTVAINARVAKATRIANAIRQASPMDDAQFVALSQALLGATDAGFEAAAGATSLKGALAALRAARGMQKVLGSSTTDFIFKPIVPCRLLDTRANGIKLVANTPFGVDFDGGNPGNAAGCTFAGVAAQTGTILTGRAALAINLTVTQPNGPGFIQARPVGTTAVTSNQNFVANQDVAAYAVIQDAGTNAEFELFASVATHAVVDVLGVFAPPPATPLDCTNVLNAAVTIVALNNFVNVADSAVAACPAGYTGTNYIWKYNGGIGGISVWNNDYGTVLGLSYAPYATGIGNSDMHLFVGRRCCRVPGF